MQPDRPWDTAPETPKFGLDPFVGNLAFMTIGGYHAGIQTQYRMQSAVRLSFMPLDGPQAGQVLSNVLVFNVRIVRRLAPMVGKTVLHRIVKDAFQGNDVYDLIDPTPADETLAADYVRYFPNRFAEQLAIMTPLHAAEEQRLQQAAQGGAQQQQTGNGNQHQDLRDMQTRAAQQQSGPPPWQQGQTTTTTTGAPQWQSQPQGEVGHQYIPPPPPGQWQQQGPPPPPPPPPAPPAWAQPSQDQPQY